MAGSRTPWCRQSCPFSRQPNPWGESMIINRNEPGQGLAGTLASLLGGDLPVAIRAYDGSHAGPSDASATLVIRSPDAVRRVLSSPGELGMARSYVAGDIELDGDIYVALAALGEQLVDGFRRPQSWGCLLYTSPSPRD